MSIIELLNAYAVQVPGEKTTFRADFTVADAFGEKAIRDTYKRAFDEWKDNCEYLTELVIVLNHKEWEHYEKRNSKLCRVYDILYRKAHSYALSHLKGEELSYYLRTTD